MLPLFLNLMGIDKREMDELNQITYKIRKSIFEVNKHLGPGLLEKAYEESLYRELLNQGLNVQRQLKVPIIYKGESFELYYRIDFLVEDKIIVELKSVELLSDLHKSQLLTYMKMYNKKLGILVNFNTVYLMDKISLIRMIL